MRLAWCTFVLAVWVVALVAGQQCSDGRPPVGERNFVSTAIDAVIEQVASQMTDKDLACIFRNTLPNTLDTTVTFPGGATVASDNLPFVITGDITAMWLTDSMNQVLPYIPYAGKDAALKTMLQGLITRQAQQINLDAFANAFTSGSIASPPSPHTDDQTSSPGFLNTRVDAMVPGVFERKYELDSLCAFLKLSRSYFDETGDTTPFSDADGNWLTAVQRVLEVRELDKLFFCVGTSASMVLNAVFLTCVRLPVQCNWTRLWCTCRPAQTRTQILCICFSATPMNPPTLSATGLATLCEQLG